jgi:hypothetical protein
MMDIRPNHPLRRMFQGLVEDAFCAQVGLCDPTLTGYLADLLVSFTHVDRLNAVRNAEGKRLDQIASMLTVTCGTAGETAAERDRAIYQHIGDFTLFWAGVYPEHLKRRRYASDVLIDYVSQGRRSYAIVSNLTRETDQPPGSLFRHLSDDFEFCIHGLALVRRGWEQQRCREFGADLLLQ